VKLLLAHGASAAICISRSDNAALSAKELAAEDPTSADKKEIYELVGINCQINQVPLRLLYDNALKKNAALVLMGHGLESNSSFSYMPKYIISLMINFVIFVKIGDKAKEILLSSNGSTIACISIDLLEVCNQIFSCLPLTEERDFSSFIQK